MEIHKCLGMFFKKQKNWFYIIVPCLLFLIFLFTYIIFGDPDNPISPFTRIFYASHSLHCVTNDVKTHNYNLISFLSSSKRISGEDRISQARTIYIGIVAVFLSLFFTKRIKKKFQMLVFLFSLINLMYLLDVHLKDLYWRQNLSYKMTISQMEDLTNSCKIETIWYEVKTDGLNAQLVTAGSRWNRISRKIHWTLRPDGEQIIYFIIPWFALYFLLIFELFLNYKNLQELRKQIWHQLKNYFCE